MTGLSLSNKLQISCYTGEWYSGFTQITAGKHFIDKILTLTCEIILPHQQIVRSLAGPEVGHHEEMVGLHNYQHL